MKIHGTKILNAKISKISNTIHKNRVKFSVTSDWYFYLKLKKNEANIISMSPHLQVWCHVLQG